MCAPVAYVPFRPMKTRTTPLLLAALAVLFLPWPLVAQIGLEETVTTRPRPQTKPDVPPEVAAQAPSLIRTFLLPSDASFGPITARAQLQGMDSPIVIGGAEPGQQSLSGGYQEIPAGSGAYEVRAGERLLASGTLRLQPGRSYTIVGWQGGNAWQAKVFADDAAAPAGDRAVRVLNFPAGRTTLLSVAGLPPVSVPADSVQEVRAPAKNSAIGVEVLAPDGGAPARSALEVDFRSVQSLYVVVAPDNRGRMRPSMIEGGAPPPVENVFASSAPAAPVSQVDQAAHERGLRRMGLEHEIGQILVQMNQPGAAAERPKLEARKKELEAQLQKLR